LRSDGRWTTSSGKFFAPLAGIANGGEREGKRKKREKREKKKGEKEGGKIISLSLYLRQYQIHAILIITFDLKQWIN
jgi:hypothetical protein